MIPLLFACGTAAPPPPTPAALVRPAGVPDDAFGMRRLAEGVQLGRSTIDTSASITGLLDDVEQAVRGSGSTRVWIDAAGTASWAEVRQLAASSAEGGATELWWVLDGTAVGPSDLTRRGTGSLRSTCGEAPDPITGLSRRYTLTLESSADETWARARVHFRPMVGDALVPTEGLSPACWAPTTCAALLDTAELVPLCEAARSQRGKVSRHASLGAADGCLAPLWRGVAPAWPTVANLQALGVPPSDVTLVPEARVPWAVVHRTLADFERLGESLPQIPWALIEGNDGPPTCDADVRSIEDLALAEALWLGASLGTTRGLDPEGP